MIKFIAIISLLVYSGGSKKSESGPWAAYHAMHRRPVVSGDRRWLEAENRILRISLENARRPEETYGRGDAENTVYPY